MARIPLPFHWTKFCLPLTPLPPLQSNCYLTNISIMLTGGACQPKLVATGGPRSTARAQTNATEEIAMKSNIDPQTLIIMAVIGIVAGYLASLLVGGSGLVRYLVTGLIGAFVGGIVLNALGINLGIRNALVAQIVTSTIGAIIVVILARLLV
jgi:uncharacterized membrane protein YeaQ/YmgE (transglycosylase-associated protein family)